MIGDTMRNYIDIYDEQGNKQQMEVIQAQIKVHGIKYAKIVFHMKMLRERRPRHLSIQMVQ